MKFGGGHRGDSNTSQMVYPVTSVSGAQVKVSRSVVIYTTLALAAMCGVPWLSQFFSDSALQMALDLLSWCFVGVLATIVLMVSVKVIDSVLDV
jgi:hypothetical protein